MVCSAAGTEAVNLTLLTTQHIRRVDFASVFILPEQQKGLCGHEILRECDNLDPVSMF